MRAPGHTPGRLRARRRDGRAGRGPRHGPARAPAEELFDEEPGRHGPPLFAKGLDKCYELGAKAIGWERRNRRPGEGSGTGPLRRGIGMRHRASGSGAGVPGTLADIVLYPDMSVEVVCGTQDIGTRDADPHGRRRRRDARARAEGHHGQDRQFRLSLGADLGRQPDDAVRGPGRARRRPQGGRTAQGRRGGQAQDRGRRRRHGRQEVLVQERPGQVGVLRRCLPRSPPGDGLPRRARRHAHETNSPSTPSAPISPRSKSTWRRGASASSSTSAAQDSGQVVNRLDGRKPGHRRHHPGLERRALRGTGHGRRDRKPGQSELARLQDRAHRSTSRRSRPCSPTSSTRGSTTSA